jgi:hypothetical protein
LGLSTSKYKFSLATQIHDPGLRRMTRNNPVAGRISVSFEREPNFFYAAGIGNKFRQVLVCNDPGEEKIIGTGARSVFDAFINGVPSPCGYLSNLRIDKGHRSRTMLARGYQFIHDLHGDSRTKLYLTSIISDNLYAKQMLTSKRMGLPFYRDFGKYHSYLIPARNAGHGRNEMTVRRAQHSDLPAVVECLRRNGQLKQFYPAYSQKDFESSNGFLKGFDLTDFLLALRSCRLVGVMGIWDQRPYKQIVVRGYSPLLGKIRPVYNCAAGILGGLKLPAVGNDLAICSAFAIAVDNNDPDVFGQLLAAACEEAGRRKCDHLAVGLHSRDTLCRTMKKRRHFLYKSDLYVVHWDDGMEDFKALDDRVPYMEVATL